MPSQEFTLADHTKEGTDIASSEALRADAVAAALPPEVLYILDTKRLYKKVAGWQPIENMLLEHLLDPTAGAYEDCWFLEIDRGTESPAAIRRKCRIYEG